MQNLLDDLTEVLQAEQSFISDGAILKNVVVEAAFNMDSRLLELLLRCDTIKSHFFTEVAGTLVFDKVQFRDFVSNKMFLPDSYTAFKNRIGLTDGRGDYLSQSSDVVLVWPYKDCVLEGGMTKEDRGRNEVFWNKTLAPDDITRLFEPKVLTGWERWDSEAVAAGKAKPVGDVSENDNLLIKGNNLLALYSLKARYAGKVKLIYIDPPYNTGNDGFRYNDRFNHSAWLTFMRNRLEVAKELLSQDGTVFLHLDDGEVHYCKVLMDEVFGRDNFINHIATRMKLTAGASGGGEDKKLKKSIEHILVYSKLKASAGGFSRFNDYYVEEDLFDHIESMEASGTSWKYTSIFEGYGDKVEERIILDGYGNEIRIEKFTGLKRSTVAKRRKAGGITERQVYAEFFGSIFSDTNAQTSIRTRIIEEYKSLADNEVLKATYVPRSGKEKGKAVSHFYVSPTIRRVIWLKDTADKRGDFIFKREKLGTYWDRFSLNNLTKEGDVQFGDGKKPESLIGRIIEIGTDEGDLVLDFFAGSGTLPAVAAKTGRRWLAVEQMDYVGELPIQRLKNIIGGEQGGISKTVGWQGGGSFVYAELASSNSAFADRIGAAQDFDAVRAIQTDILATGYLNVDVDLSAIDRGNFSALSLCDAKRVLMDCLDANHLYVNLGSLGDADFDVSDEDAAATRSFYRLNA